MTGTNVAVCEVPDEQSEWVRAHEALSRLARERAAMDAEEGRWLLVALRSAVHVHLGFGSFGEYVERLFGYKPRSTQEKLRVAEALEDLPAIARALHAGALNWSAVRELTRVAVRETEREWLEVARGKTVHQLEALVAGKSPGDRPASVMRPEARRHVLRFDVSPETLALFREAMNELGRDGNPLDDDSVLMLMARNVLGGPRDAGRASYQIALSVCPECGRAGQRASGELVPVGPEILAMADCDGQHLGSIAAPATPVASEDVTATESDAAHETHSAHVGARAKQTIPPATRRTVLARDRHHCVIPGCRNSRFLDLHHVLPRSEGGGNDADNLVTLCGAHHRAAHRGELVVTGRASSGLRFRHADGADYGTKLDPRAAETRKKVFVALRNLGFRERDVLRTLKDLSVRGNGQATSVECVLRDALRELTS